MTARTIKSDTNKLTVCAQLKSEVRTGNTSVFVAGPSPARASCPVLVSHAVTMYSERMATITATIAMISATNDWCAQRKSMYRVSTGRFKMSGIMPNFSWSQYPSEANDPDPRATARTPRMNVTATNVPLSGLSSMNMKLRKQQLKS